MATPPSEVRATDPGVYRENLYRLVGDRNPLEILAQTAAALAEVVRAHSAAELRARPQEGKWTPAEIIGHLTDSEWVYGFRMRLVRCEDHPEILGTSQDLWVARQRHNEREPQEMLNMFRTLRQFNLELWKGLSAQEFGRTGRHNERGPESLEVMLHMWAGHDLSHLSQIARFLKAIRQHGTA